MKGRWPEVSPVTIQINDNTCILMTDQCFFFHRDSQEALEALDPQERRDLL